MATCPRCGKKMRQEAEACDLCWLKSDLSQAEKHIAELEIRAENAERERDEARAEAMRLMQLCADRPNLDHIPFQPAPVEDWFNRMDNAGKGGA